MRKRALVWGVALRLQKNFNSVSVSACVLWGLLRLGFVFLGGRLVQRLNTWHFWMIFDVDVGAKVLE